MPKIKNSFLEEGVIFDFRAFVSLIYPAFRGDRKTPMSELKQWLRKRNQ
jgi:hypothetical protein